MFARKIGAKTLRAALPEVNRPPQPKSAPAATLDAPLATPYNKGTMKTKLKIALRWLLTILMVAAGVNHFLDPAVYLAIMPKFLPAPDALVATSGIAEIAGGLGLILPQTRRLAAFGLIALFLAILPANLNMAINELPFGDHPVAPWVLWARLPLQALLIAWAYWYTRKDRAAA